VYHETPIVGVMEEDDSIIKKIAGLAGRWSSHRIRFGGVVGKIAYISVAAIAGTATVVLYAHGADWLKAFAVVAIVIFAFYVVHRILEYAGQHPEATLEGSEILTWQQQLLAAKGLPNVPESPSISGAISIKPIEN